MFRQRFLPPAGVFWLASVCLSGPLAAAPAVPISAVDSAMQQTSSEQPDAQRALTVTDIMKFRSIESLQLSDEGDWIAYEARPDRGDSYVLFRSLQSASEWRVERANAAQIASDRQWGLAKQLAPLAEREQADKNDKPKAAAVLINLNNGEQQVFSAIQRAAFTGDAGTAAFLSEAQAAATSEEQGTDHGADQGVAKKTQTTATLTLVELASQQRQDIRAVSQFAVAERGPRLAYVLTQSVTDDSVDASADQVEPSERYELRVINSSNQSQLTLASDLAEVLDLRFADDGKQLAALVKMPAKDTDNQDDYRVLYWRYGQQQASDISPRIQQDDTTLVVGKNSQLRFSQNSDEQPRLFFGLQPQVSTASASAKASDDIYDIDALLAKRELQVWHGEDARIKPQEKLTYKNRQKQTLSGVYWIDDERYQLLANKASDDLMVGENSQAALLQDSDPYLQAMTWDGFYHDLYWVNLSNGERQLVTQRLSSYFDRSLSPSGRYVAWYSDNQLHIYDSRRQQQITVAAPEGVSWADEDHDYPRPASGYGIAGWLADDAGFITYDKYDVWQITPAGKAINLTQGQGRQQQLQYRVVNTHPERLTLSDRPLLRAYSTSDKHFGFYRLDVADRELSKLIEKNKKYDFVKAAKDADVLLFTEQDFQQFPDLWVTNHDFQQPRQVTDLNPQIDEFAWGSSELVEWTSSNGEPLQGVLIKPANYEEGKRYPVLVYYYRFFSQRLYEFNEMKVNHRPNFPFYTSNGYAVFLPDVKFTVGEPGASATQALVPGVQKLVDMGIADADAIGLHGHSWSGYQTAFVITQTDIFKAAVAGAPVTNMTSAYSGIRWGSGLARQFQYEQTQSRIGKTLYEAPQLYIENSPVFYADRINTPLVIEFGDEDGAVPWEQGIELYLALRRLHKPVVMLQYEGEPHHLKKYPNKVDYTLKMKAFFDHYLKGEPAPKWWQEGEAYAE